MIAQAQWTKRHRAIERRPSLWKSMNNNSKEVEVIDSHTDKIYKTVQMDLNGARFQRSLKLIALGVYCHHFGKRWEGSIHVHADFNDFTYEQNKAEIDANRVLVFNCAEKLFAGIPRFGDNRDVFYYQVCEPESSFHFIIRIGFYGGCTATVFLGKMIE